LILAEEEISDVSLATFHVFDRENPPLSEGIRVAVMAVGAAGVLMAAGVAGAPMAAVALIPADAPWAAGVLIQSVVPWVAVALVRAGVVIREAARLATAAAVEAVADAAEHGSELRAWVAPAAQERAGNGTRTWVSGSTSAING
jgi:hypothetical protein